MTLLAVFTKFLGYGLNAWGGPVAQIAMLRRDLVDCAPAERWIDPSKFGRVLAVYQALPGPEAMELCCYFGLLKRGRLGAIAAGMGFILPGFVLLIGLAAVYQRIGLHPVAVAAMAGVQPVVLAMVAVAAWRIGSGAVRTASASVVERAHKFVPLALLLVTGAQTIGGVPFWVTLSYAALVGWLAFGQRARAQARVRGAVRDWILAGLLVAGVGLIWLWRDGLGTEPPLFWAGQAPPRTTGAEHATANQGLWALGWLGLKAGLLTFGGAYTALPLLSRAAVAAASNPGGWMTTTQFVDGVGLVGVLPAPLVTVGAFVGYLGAGMPGALMLSAGIYLPAFAFTVIGHGLMERVVGHPRIGAALEGLSLGAAGLLIGAALDLLVPLVTAGVHPGPRGWIWGWPLAAFAASGIILLRVKLRALTPILLLVAALLGVWLLR